MKTNKQILEVLKVDVDVLCYITSIYHPISSNLLETKTISSHCTELLHKQPVFNISLSLFN